MLKNRMMIVTTLSWFFRIFLFFLLRTCCLTGLQSYMYNECERWKGLTETQWQFWQMPLTHMLQSIWTPSGWTIFYNYQFNLTRRSTTHWYQSSTKSCMRHPCHCVPPRCKHTPRRLLPCGHNAGMAQSQRCPGARKPTGKSLKHRKQSVLEYGRKALILLLKGRLKKNFEKKKKKKKITKFTACMACW